MPNISFAAYEAGALSVVGALIGFVIAGGIISIATIAFIETILKKDIPKSSAIMRRLAITSWIVTSVCSLIAFKSPFFHFLAPQAEHLVILAVPILVGFSIGFTAVVGCVGLLLKEV